MTAPSLSDHPADHVADPYPYFKLLRETDPVHFDAVRGTWLIARHEDVSRLLRLPGPAPGHVPRHHPHRLPECPM